jgi:hypothetical protein
MTGRWQALTLRHFSTLPKCMNRWWYCPSSQNKLQQTHFIMDLFSSDFKYNLTKRIKFTSANQTVSWDQLFSLEDFSTLKMEATRSSETSVLTRPRRRHFPKDGILHTNKLIPIQIFLLKISMGNFVSLEKLRWVWPRLWSSGQSSWLQIWSPGFESRHYQNKKSSGSGTGSTQPREYNWGATW